MNKEAHDDQRKDDYADTNTDPAPPTLIDRLKSRRTIIVLLLVAAIAAAGYAWYAHRPRKTELVLSGNVDIREVNLAFRVGGRVRTLAVDEGATVQPGQVLGELDAEPLRNTLAQAEAGLQASTAKDALMRAGYRVEDVARLRAALQGQQAVLLNAEQVLARQRQLAGTGAVAERTLDEARATRDRAAAETEAARQQYEQAQRGYRKEDMAQAAADLAMARANVATAQLQVGDAVLKAPSSGVILTRAVEAGSMVAAGATAFTLSLNDPVWVRAYVEESDLGRIASGTAMTVLTDAGRQYNVVVGFVSPTAEFTPKQVETQDLRTALVYRLRIVVSHPDSGLRQGMPVTVRLAPAQ